MREKRAKKKQKKEGEESCREGGDRRDQKIKLNVLAGHRLYGQNVITSRR